MQSWDLFTVVNVAPTAAAERWPEANECWIGDRTVEH